MSDPLVRLPAFRKLAAARLAGFPHVTVPDSAGSRRAGVVLCVVEHEDVPSVILIRRAYRGRNAGQWGLPGGRVDPGETPEQAALRELHEELGVRVDPADVLGRLDDFPASSGFSITPIVAVPTDPGPLLPSPDEVHSVHHVSLSRLAADDTPRWVPQLDGDGADPTARTHLLQMRLRPDWVVHAPTGAMLWQFREVVLLGRDAADARVAGFRQPDWTRH